jgi:mannose-6-phosphate isomerase
MRILVAEIQQNSNTTYRVYDWNRVGSNSQPRLLHVDKALDVINFDQVEPILRPPVLVAEAGGVRRLELCRNRYFVTERVEIRRGASFSGECDGRSLEIWGVIGGQVQIDRDTLTAVQFVLLPATMGPFGVTARADSILLRTFVA